MLPKPQVLVDAHVLCRHGIQRGDSGQNKTSGVYVHAFDRWLINQMISDGGEAELEMQVPWQVFPAWSGNFAPAYGVA